MTRKVAKEVRFATLDSKSKSIKHSKDLRRHAKAPNALLRRRSQVKPKVYSTLKNSSKELLSSFFNSKNKPYSQ